MKKFYAAVFAFVMLFSISAFAEGRTVVDEADYLTDSEEIALEERLDEIKSKHSIDAAVVIVNTIGEKTAEKMLDSRITVWAQHGIFAAGKSLDEAFGLIETVEKAAEIYIKTLPAPIVNTISDSNLRMLADAFKVVPKAGYLDN